MPCLVRPSYVTQPIRLGNPRDPEALSGVLSSVMLLFFHPLHLENVAIYMTSLFSLITVPINEKFFKPLCRKISYAILLEKVDRRLYEKENWVDS